MRLLSHHGGRPWWGGHFGGASRRIANRPRRAGKCHRVQHPVRSRRWRLARISSNPYVVVLRTPGAAAFFGTAAPIRLGIAMSSLGLVWLIHGSQRSYGVAGLVAGAYAIADAVIGPQVAHLIDRFGQSRVPPITLVVHALAITALIISTVGDAPIPVLITFAALAGASVPPIGAMTAARWSAMARGPAKPSRPGTAPPSPALSARGLSTAFSLETMSTDIAFLLGPAIVVLIATSYGPVFGTSIATAMVVCAGFVFANLRRTAPPIKPKSPKKQPRTENRENQPIRARRVDRGFLVLWAVNFAFGTMFGSLQLSVSAFAAAHQVAGAAGILYGVMSAASLLSGVVYGLRERRLPASVRLPVSLLFVAGCCALMAIAGDPLLLGLFTALLGLGISPTVITAAEILERTRPSGVITRSFAWMNSGSAAGIALAGAFAGQLIDSVGVFAGFLTPAVTIGAAGLIVWLNRRQFREAAGDAARGHDQLMV